MKKKIRKLIYNYIFFSFTVDKVIAEILIFSAGIFLEIKRDSSGKIVDSIPLQDIRGPYLESDSEWDHQSLLYRPVHGSLLPDWDQRSSESDWDHDTLFSQQDDLPNERESYSQRKGNSLPSSRAEIKKMLDILTRPRPNKITSRLTK